MRGMHAAPDFAEAQLWALGGPVVAGGGLRVATEVGLGTSTGRWCGGWNVVPRGGWARGELQRRDEVVGSTVAL